MDAVSDLFDRYAAAFDDYDDEAVLSCFAYPTTIWQFGKGHVFEDEDDLYENVEKLLGAYEEAGVVETRYQISRQTETPEGAFVHVEWEQDDDTGQTVHAFDCIYLLIALDGALAIATTVNADPS